jgi:hypothetical protein
MLLRVFIKVSLRKTTALSFPSYTGPMAGLWKIFRSWVLNLRPELRIDYVSVCQTMQELVLSCTKKERVIGRIRQEIDKNIGTLLQISLYHSAILNSLQSLNMLRLLCRLRTLFEFMDLTSP